jgi:hypothetical protein
MTKPKKKAAAKKKAPALAVAGSVLSFNMQDQQQINWCWAAVAASVGDFFAGQPTWDQCTIANQELMRSDCCDGGADGPCNVYGFLASSLNRVHCLKSWAIDQRAAFAAVCDEIDSSRPVCLRVAWRGGGAHFVAITGYSDRDPSLARVRIEDPVYRYHDIAWTDFLTAYAPAGSLQGDWTDTYYTTAPVAQAGGHDD